MALGMRELSRHLRELTPGGDPNQRAFRVRLEPVGGDVLPIGLTLEVNIVTRQKAGAILVPESAFENGHVWRVETGRARRVAVRAGISGPERIEIASGLSASDTVIVDAPEGLRDGTRVRTAMPE